MKERDGCSAVRFPVGWLLLCWRDCTLVGAEWRWEAPPLGEMQGQPCAEQATAEIAAYLVDPLHAPAIPWTFDRGTPFQQQVWQALADIPAG
ncbi:MAG TPA: hypothetical protein VFN52_07000, partial [Acidiferrobacteraceae bacterium]|nr:hypothetical protein [Acidiferrobacteraceae bacterium]